MESCLCNAWLSSDVDVPEINADDSFDSTENMDKASNEGIGDEQVYSSSRDVYGKHMMNLAH